MKDSNVHLKGGTKPLFKVSYILKGVWPIYNTPFSFPGPFREEKKFSEIIMHLLIDRVDGHRSFIYFVISNAANSVPWNQLIPFCYTVKQNKPHF